MLSRNMNNHRSIIDIFYNNIFWFYKMMLTQKDMAIGFISKFMWKILEKSS